MELFVYSKEEGLIKPFKFETMKEDSYIMISEDIGEFVFTESKISKRNLKKHLKKNLNIKNEVYTDVRAIGENKHCIYIDKFEFDKVFNQLKSLTFDIELPIEFIMKLLKERTAFSGKIHVNIGDFIFLATVNCGKIKEVIKLFKDGYGMTGTDVVDFFRSSIFWLED